MIPDYLTVANPVDNGAQFLVTNPVEDRRRVFDLVCADENVDVVVVGLTGALGRLTDRFAADIVSFIDELSEASRRHVELLQDRRGRVPHPCGRRSAAVQVVPQLLLGAALLRRVRARSEALPARVRAKRSRLDAGLSAEIDDAVRRATAQS